jgi:hypothetical protein
MGCPFYGRIEKFITDGGGHRARQAVLAQQAFEAASFERALAVREKAAPPLPDG